MKTTTQISTKCVGQFLFHVTLFDRMVSFDMPVKPAMLLYYLEEYTVENILGFQVPYELALAYAQSRGIVPDPDGTGIAYEALESAARAHYKQVVGQEAP